MSSDKEFIFTWLIENFKLLPQANCESIKSPLFTVKKFHSTDWYLNLYPRGSSDSDHISCFLVRSDSNDPKEIGICFLLSIDCVSRKATHCFNNEAMSVGWVNFLKREIVENLQDCVIQCRMRISPIVDVEDITEQSSHFLMPYSLNTQIMKAEFMKEFHATEHGRIWNITFPTAFYTSQSFAHTHVFAEKRIFICAIHDYLYPGSKRRQRIPVATPYGTLLIMLFMGEKESSDSLEIEICLKDTETGESNCMWICKIELIDSKGEIHSSEEGHLFKAHAIDEIWNFRHPFEWSEPEKLKNASLRFTLTFSKGELFSDTEWSAGVSESISKLSFRDEVSKDLHRLFTEKMFCDVTIRTKNESFDTHKTVLCSRSQVFATMFESNKDSNVIYISELDSDTVRQMLLFMYTGSTEKLNDKTAMKLYKAADKYGMNSLKDTCRNYLKNNLTVENICSVLLLADAHKDQQLSKCSVSFVSYFREHILESQHWKELEEHDARFCLTILTKLCLKLSP